LPHRILELHLLITHGKNKEVEQVAKEENINIIKVKGSIEEIIIEDLAVHLVALHRIMAAIPNNQTKYFIKGVTNNLN